MHEFSTTQKSFLPSSLPETYWILNSQSISLVIRKLFFWTHKNTVANSLLYHFHCFSIPPKEISLAHTFFFLSNTLNCPTRPSRLWAGQLNLLTNREMFPACRRKEEWMAHCMLWWWTITLIRVLYDLSDDWDECGKWLKPSGTEYILHTLSSCRKASWWL